MSTEGVLEGLRFQRAAIGQKSLSSPLYRALLDAAIADVEAGGVCDAVLTAAPRGLDPIPDALALRFLGAVHRLVLEGRAPELAAWFPTVGGTFTPEGADPGPAFLATIAERRDELVAGLAQGVQTNEVGRCATLAVGFTALLRRWRLPLRLLEVGASAGLNLRWDSWRYEADGAWGSTDAPLGFGAGVYDAPLPDVRAPLGPGEAVAERHGCDRPPVDPSSEAGRLLLRSFVWPDQAHRHARLDAALEVAARVPADVVAADAADWIAPRLEEPADGRTTVVYHSIVWQYLNAEVRSRFTDAMCGAAQGASRQAPLAWLRMEPGEDPTAAAELRVRSWPGGEDALLAYSGYHGFPVFRA